VKKKQRKKEIKMGYLKRTYYILHDGFYCINFAMNVKDARRAMREHDFQKVGQITLQIPYISWGTPEELENERRRIAIRKWEEQRDEARQ
jgi:hypothetical protein